jgi:PAS domain S-box-containing protein
MNATEPTRQGTGIPFLLIFLFLAIGIPATGVFSYRNFERRFRTQIEHQLSAIAELKTNELMQWRAERQGDAQSLFNNSAFCALVKRFLTDPRDTNAHDQLQSWLTALQTAYQYDKLFLLDAKGAARLNVPDIAETMAPHLAEDAAQALHSGRIVFADFHRDVPGGFIHLSLLVPIRDMSASNNPLGVVVLRIDPGVTLYPMIRRWPIPSLTAETLLVRREGDDVLFLNDLRFAPNSALNMRISLRRTETPSAMAVLGQVGIVEGIDYRGVSVLAAIRPIEGSPWYMVARMDAAEAHAPLRERLWETIILAGALILGAGGSVGLLWRQQRVSFYKEQLAAAAALRESEERFRRAVTDSPFPILLHAEDGAIIHASNSWCEITGYAPEELATIADWTERAYGERKETVQAEIDALYGLEKRKAEGDYSIRTKDGTTRIWDFSSAPLGRLPDGRRLVLSMAMDVTGRREAENEARRLNEELDQRVKERTSQLEEANRELEAFSYSVSHDLRAPLRAIDGFAHILVTEQAGSLDKSGKRSLEIICSEARRMGQLIDDLLSFSQIARLPLRVVEVDMQALAQSVYDECAAAAKGRKIRLTLKPLPFICGDPAMLRQVMVNLIGNAVKFTGFQALAEIEIGSHTDGDTNCFYIRDNGVGFEMKYVDRLFGVFQRLHTEAEFEGTGVGLALAHRVIHRHGGRIWAEGTVNEGATFYFTLPVRKEFM